MIGHRLFGVRERAVDQLQAPRALDQRRRDEQLSGRFVEGHDPGGHDAVRNAEQVGGLLALPQLIVAGFLGWVEQARRLRHRYLCDEHLARAGEQQAGGESRQHEGGDDAGS